MEDHDIVRSDLAKERNILASERTRFAAERTVSAWIRTSLASIGGGFAIIRLLTFETINHRIIANAVGELLIIWGIVILLLSLIDYRKTCQKLKHTINKRNEWWVTITIFVFIIISVLLFFVTIS